MGVSFPLHASRLLTGDPSPLPMCNKHWPQLTGMFKMCGYGYVPVQNTDHTAPFDIEAAPLAPGINVGRDQSFPTNRPDGPAHSSTCTHPIQTDIDSDPVSNPESGDLIQRSSCAPLSSAQALTPGTVCPLYRLYWTPIKTTRIFFSRFAGTRP
ncbi:hypothetical protein BJV78DRAFT_1244396 [Lactifluus subvellereus]|nr:hypothetical protein BJV78DRAFT_1244396 [Lactifluus subvellereus]